MAIEFARIRFVGRSTGGSACNSSAYNARSKVVDERTGEVLDYTKRGGWSGQCHPPRRTCHSTPPWLEECGY